MAADTAAKGAVVVAPPVTIVDGRATQLAIAKAQLRAKASKALERDRPSEEAAVSACRWS